ncbi:GNAT family N-acetyltransferase [Vibrio parahaemolyticus]|uniref:GNAT family N-acetyltransferase n=1 Tax=Vibrio parahaemolyticus TaxID=670 RepID=UPI00193CF1F8|nr:GNAT family N-acetyltransferase [Vibrio parahaemolyticus]EHH1222438.1 GNAT family N-acetyltransferase [Vibrio parahaemolyticus]EIY8172875.1 GNAT family N-acetyltransferase [Vibrio parahaemolyticus]EIY8250665.1 GNAT family N-acetyltransferase [Vibrio parahaemolyticus]ELA8141089.1 GNAT family N-acetyltransferase [Vibrio parahaemolyticus]MBM4894566.1 GNAT family N-acetyltransferase [Vibrio parahaemolyticus]
MTMLIREGTLEEALQVVTRVKEFANGETLDSMSQRLGDKNSLILVAEKNGVIVGFKIGYELDEDTFYSWFGGVAPQARNEGVAQMLLEAQEEWVAEQGYKTLKVKSRNQFPAMLRLLLRNGYLIEKFEEKINLRESRVHFIKAM